MDELLFTNACTLPATERPPRLDELDRLFRTAVREVVQVDGAVRLHLVGDEGRLAEVRDLVDRERRCCSFLSFDLAESERAFDLVVSAPPEHADLLAALAARAESLSR